MREHTPTPWQQHDNADIYGPNFAAAIWTSKGPGRGFVADCRQSGITKEQQVENAKFIVRACNSHDELLAAAEQAFGALVGAHAADDSVQGRARIRLLAAIAKAKGGDA